MNMRIPVITVIIMAVLVCFAIRDFRQSRFGEVNLSQINIMKKISITSSEFQDFGAMPAKFTCDGESLNPPLEISGIPEGTKSLSLIVDDPDAPGGTWVHWVKFNISPETSVIEEGKDPAGISGVGTSGKLFYEAPCPPSDTHRYRFKIYAFDEILPLREGVSASEIETVSASHIIGQGILTGLYSRAR